MAELVDILDCLLHIQVVFSAVALFKQPHVNVDALSFYMNFITLLLLFKPCSTWTFQRDRMIEQFLSQMCM